MYYYQNKYNLFLRQNVYSKQQLLRGINKMNFYYIKFKVKFFQKKYVFSKK